MRRRGPGRVRQKLAEMLAKRLSDDGLPCRVSPDDLHAAQGHYRTDWRADCYRWEGSVGAYVGDGDKTVSRRVYSYSPMTDCIRGFDWDFDKHGMDIDVTAINERKHPPARRG